MYISPGWRTVSSPSYMTITSDDNEDLEEERRLCYVGITRAEQELTLTCARRRMVRGETQYNKLSRFVKEIPMELIDTGQKDRGRNRDPGAEYIFPCKAGVSGAAVCGSVRRLRFRQGARHVRDGRQFWKERRKTAVFRPSERKSAHSGKRRKTFLRSGRPRAACEVRRGDRAGDQRGRPGLRGDR